MNDINKDLDRAYKELHVSDPYSDNHEEFMKEFDDPIEVKLSDQSKDSMDSFFIVNEDEVKKNNEIIKTLAICASMFCIICLCVVFFVKKDKSVELSETGMKYEENWVEFKEETSHSKDRDIIIKIYKDKDLESELKLKYDGKKYSYGEDGEKYNYLLDESGTIKDIGLKLRLIVLSNEKYSFEELYKGLYYNTDKAKDSVDLDELKDAIGTLNQTMEDLSNDLDNGEDAKSDNEYEKLEDIKYQLIYYY